MANKSKAGTEKHADQLVRNLSVTAEQPPLGGVKPAPCKGFRLLPIRYRSIGNRLSKPDRLAEADVITFSQIEKKSSGGLRPIGADVDSRD